MSIFKEMTSLSAGANSSMPFFNVTFQKQTAVSAIMRYYDGYGYGYQNGMELSCDYYLSINFMLSSGWRIPPALPEISGAVLQNYDGWIPCFAYFTPNYWEGAYGLG